MAKSKIGEISLASGEFSMNVENIVWSKKLKAYPKVQGWVTPFGLFSRTNEPFMSKGREIKVASQAQLKIIYDSHPELRVAIVAPEGYKAPDEN